MTRRVLYRWAATAATWKRTVTFCRSGDDERLGRKVFLLRDGFRNDAFVEEEVSLLRRHLLGPKRLVVDRESRDRGPEKSQGNGHS